MNKQDRQNKTILKRERDSRHLPAPCSPFANVTMGESSTLSRKRGWTSRQAPHELGSGRSKGMPRAGGKQTSESVSSLSWAQDMDILRAELGVR